MLQLTLNPGLTFEQPGPVILWWSVTWYCYDRHLAEAGYGKYLLVPFLVRFGISFDLSKTGTMAWINSPDIPKRVQY